MVPHDVLMCGTPWPACCPSAPPRSLRGGRFVVRTCPKSTRHTSTEAEPHGRGTQHTPSERYPRRPSERTRPLLPWRRVLIPANSFSASV